MKRRSSRLSVHCTRFSIAPLFSGITQNNLSWIQESPAAATVLKYPQLADFGKVIRLKRRLGRFPPPELYWTSTLRSDSDNTNVQGKCAINKPFVTKISDLRSIPHSNTISPFQNEQKLSTLSRPQQAPPGTSSVSNKFLQQFIQSLYKSPIKRSVSLDLVEIQLSPKLENVPLCPTFALPEGAITSHRGRGAGVHAACRVTIQILVRRIFLLVLVLVLRHIASCLLTQLRQGGENHLAGGLKSRSEQAWLAAVSGREAQAAQALESLQVLQKKSKERETLVCVAEPVLPSG